MNNKQYDLPKLRCLRCGHTWIPRTPKKPKVCPNPKCKSPYWHIPKGERPLEEQCYFCGSEDILIPKIAIIDAEYSFCKKCVHDMSAEDFWKSFFRGLGYTWPPKIKGARK